jgi:hypothetical protein
MNEPLITLSQNGGGDPVRRFVDGDAPHGGGAARPKSPVVSVLAQNPAQRALLGAAELGRAAAALTKAGLGLARRR